MSSSPIIGFTLDYEPPGGYSKLPWYAIRENYMTAVSGLGAVPVALPHEPDLAEKYLGLIDGLVVTGGAGLVQGLGRTDAIGVAWAVVVFGCEAAFTLLAIPVLGRHGPWGVSVHATWLATVMFAVLAMAREGPAAVTRLSGPDWLAVGYLAVAVTAVAFVLWYSSVRQLGASRAGLLTGVAPVAAAATGVLLGGPAPRPLVWAGIAVVAVGLALGLTGGKD